MRRMKTWRCAGFGLAASLVVLTLVGAGVPKKKGEPTPFKVDETLADLAYVRQSETKVEGVGLVIGLHGTGSNAPPSVLRTDLVDEMRKANVPHPEQWLERKDTTMVIVRGKIPSGVKAGDHFDVDIELPPGCATTSLAGGHLLVTQLRQVVVTPDAGLKKSSTLATAGGPMMIGKLGEPANARFGRVLGGGRVKSDVPYTMVVREDRKSGRTVKLIEEVIRQRFHQSDGINQQGMATGKTDMVLILKVPKIYHHNQSRYFQILQSICVVQAPALEAQRIERWGAELLDPKTAGRAALKLEGIGSNATQALKAGLASTNGQVKFFAAETLAYLGDVSGADVLTETAINQKEFRNPALRALASMDQSAGLMKLRGLLAQSDVDLRYGAFDALRTADPTDPFLGQIPVYDEPEDRSEMEDLALQLDNVPKRRKRLRPEDPFQLYVVDAGGPPMIHIARNLRCEIVLFGRGLKLLPPVVLGAGGPILINAAEGDELLQISRIDSRTLDGPESRVTTPMELATVVRQVAQLGATYPDVVDMLTAAFKQKNLPGPLVVDAIPMRSQAYDEAQLLGEGKKDSALKKASAEPPKRTSILERVRGRFKR